MRCATPSQLKATLTEDFRKLLTEAALIEFGNDRPLQFVALVDEREPEGKADVLEDVGVLRPGDDGARAHDGRDVAVHEGVAGEVGDPHHLADDVAALIGAIVLRLGEHDLDLVVVRQVVQRGDDRPAVHLRLVDLLGAVIEAGGVAKAHRIGGREQAERRMRTDHPALVEQGEAAGGFQHPLDHEHHVRTAGIVLVEAERDVMLIGPRQDAVAEFGDLEAVLDDDGVLADQVDTADVAVEIDPHARPVQAGRHLFDMGRLAGAVIARDNDTAVVREARQDRQRGRPVEPVILIDVRDIVVAFRVGRDFHVAVEPELLANRHFDIGQAGDLLRCGSH